MYNIWPRDPHIIDKKYLEYIRNKGCQICLQKADAHHLDAGGHGSDYSVIPLCRKHHSEYHQIGKEKFEGKYHIDVWKVCWAYVCEATGLHPTADPFDIASPAEGERED